MEHGWVPTVVRGSYARVWSRSPPLIAPTKKSDGYPMRFSSEPTPLTMTTGMRLNHATSMEDGDGVV